MTKDSLAENIISVVENGKLLGDTNQEILDGVKSLLEPLEPHDREAFAKWGYTKDRETPENCW